MSTYKVALDSGKVTSLKKYRFKSEGTYIISPQELIVNNPQIILDIPELEIQVDERLIVAKEYGSPRGSIDVLIITSNADVIIVETKLLRNPESHRTVVAQAIDYAKALYDQNSSDLMERLSQNKTVDKSILSEFKKDDFWRASLDKNISSGNFQVVILGDKIHPNVLGMVESIQSAPHMAFSTFLIELDPFRFDDGTMIISPRIISRTVEIERSVIRIEIDHQNKAHKIESGIPDKKGKGTKPILTPSQYLDNLSKPEFRKPIENYWDNWKALGGDIRFGGVGFSSGIQYGDKRITPFFIYNNRMTRLNEKASDSINIPENVFRKYEDDLKKSPNVYDRYVVGNRVEIPFSELSADDLNVFLNAAVNLGKNLVDDK